MSLFGGILGGRFARTIGAGRSRIVEYDAYDLLYEGKVVTKSEVRDLDHNFARPVANAAAGFLAGRGLEWDVRGDEGLTRAAGEIWDRSGGDAAFQAAALTGTIAGDLGVKAEVTEDGPRLRFLDPAICHPEFDPHDVDRLTGFVVAYQTEGTQGGTVRHFEAWRDGTVSDAEGDDVGTYDEALMDGPPFSWIRNDGRLGKRWGRSDLAGLAGLTLGYDSLSRRLFFAQEYWCEPNVYVRGAPSGKLSADSFGGRRVFRLPEGGEIGFIEWKGERPGIEETLERTLASIRRVTETPKVAFGDMESVGDVSGTALRLMFAPLTNKTLRKRSTWGPALERAMRQALALGGTVVAQRDVSAVWPDPVPTNEREAREVLEIERRLGASRSQVLAKLGYTPEQVDRAAAENEAEAEASARRAQAAFARGL